MGRLSFHLEAGKLPQFKSGTLSSLEQCPAFLFKIQDKTRHASCLQSSGLISKFA